MKIFRSSQKGKYKIWKTLQNSVRRPKASPRIIWAKNQIPSIFQFSKEKFGIMLPGFHPAIWELLGAIWCSEWTISKFHSCSVSCQLDAWAKVSSAQQTLRSHFAGGISLCDWRTLFLAGLRLKLDFGSWKAWEEPPGFWVPWHVTVFFAPSNRLSALLASLTWTFSVFSLRTIWALFPPLIRRCLQKWVYFFNYFAAVAAKNVFFLKLRFTLYSQAFTK